MASNIHADCTAIIPTEEGCAESVGMQNCDGAAVSRPHSFGLGHLARHHICRVDSNASVMRRNTAASHGTLVGINRLDLHHRQKPYTNWAANCYSKCAACTLSKWSNRNRYGNKITVSQSVW